MPRDLERPGVAYVEGGMCQYYCLFSWLFKPNRRRCAPVPPVFVREVEVVRSSLRSVAEDGGYSKRMAEDRRAAAKAKGAKMSLALPVLQLSPTEPPLMQITN